MDDLFDGPSHTAMATAAKYALKLGHRQIGAGHLLAALLMQDSSASRVLSGFGVSATKVMSHLAALPRPELTGPDRLDKALLTSLRTAQHQATEAGTQMTTSHLVRVVLNTGDGHVEAILIAAKTSTAQVLTALDTLDPKTAQAQQAFAQARAAGNAELPGDLSKFGQDLVARSRAGQLFPVHGRDRELDRVQVILGRRGKNNPVLIGEAGVGKTAVVEALAHHIASGRCAEHLTGRPLVALDVASMIAGAKARGEFEARLKKALAAAEAVHAILFIDEIHQIVGAGAKSGGMDVANLLKEKLARGQLSLIGATTVEEYRKHIESDAALERRFEQVRIDAPSVEQTIAILRTLRPGFGAHHKVTYTDDALSAAARLTDKHVRDRQLPDKAIDAIDEAGAAASIAMMRAPQEVRAAYDTRAKVRADLAKAVHDERYEDAIPLAAKDKDLTAQILHADSGDLSIVDGPAIARIVAATAGVPVGAVADSEQELLRTLEERLLGRVIGQEHAVRATTAVVRRRRMLGADRPTSLMFAGPTGVGKTELAKALADILFATGSTDGSAADVNGSLLRLDMSEFAEKHTVSRLVGAPPGYVGYDQGGELTEAVRRNPYAVVLLDEVEKAHPDVFDLLLQILEDGHLTDGSGKVVSFKNTIVILTSNLGSGAGSRSPIGFANTDAGSLDSAARARVLDAVKAHFRPELLNRFDDIIVFDKLTKTDLTSILANMLDRPLAQLAEKGVRITLTDAALDRLLGVGYDPAMGARPLRRAITRLLENPLSDALLSGGLPHGSHALVDAVDSKDELSVVPVPDLVDHIHQEAHALATDG